MGDMDKTCSSCIHLLPDTGEIRRDRFGDAQYSICRLLAEYADENDGVCDLYCESPIGK